MLLFPLLCLLLLSSGTLWEGEPETAFQSTPKFDNSLVEIALYHSQATYCVLDIDSPSTVYEPSGPLAGFHRTFGVYNGDYDTHGYIGYNLDDNTIVVAFRGSESTANWISDITANLVDYPLCANCQVHKGFYETEQASIVDVLTEVSRLKESMQLATVIITGHSLGAALATYTAVDLQEAGVSNVWLINFGSPRCGNEQFADWCSNTALEGHIMRVTHHKDMAVHYPTRGQFSHISGEWYEPDDHVDPVHISYCHGKEDAHCSYQWTFTNVEDHLWYLGLPLGTSEGACDLFQE